jgi:flavodoxin
MKAIIIYNTMTGNTRLIATKMKKVLEKYSHECHLFRDNEIQTEVKKNSMFFNDYELLCLGSCTHGGSPAISFNSFMKSFINYDLDGKSLICFSSSGFPNIWKNTCNKIKVNFPHLKHIGNFGCTLRKINPAIKNFENIIKGL